MYQEYIRCSQCVKIVKVDIWSEQFDLELCDNCYYRKKIRDCNKKKKEKA